MKQIKAIIILLVFAAISVNIAAQSMDNMKSKHMDAMNHMINSAVCVLYPTVGNDVKGVVTFTKVEGGIKVVADLEGLTPGKHGIHIHEYGDCTAPDGTSAGGHFNPTKMEHGSPMGSMHHAGDMGNIVADSNGKAHLEYVDADISFFGMKSIIGRSVVVHKDEDDMKTQPTGNSGARVACGVIGIGK
ncbi:MAG: superoxide dismutase family protein [Paludibacter sp.]|nr:superoxide dismutase family protein [Paludibacter sp.]